MTEEEKKAIENLIEIREFANLSSYLDVKINQLNSIDTILNLIETQQKEIEELKENYIRLQNTEAIQDIYIKKDKIKAILSKYGKKEIEYAPDFYKEIQSLLEEDNK